MNCTLNLVVLVFGDSYRFSPPPQQQTPVVSCYPAPALVHNFVLLFLLPCGLHMTPMATGSLKPSLLVCPLLGGPARHRSFVPALHLLQRKSSRNLHLQYSAKSLSIPCCESLITTRSDHPPVLGRSRPHPCITMVAWYTTQQILTTYYMSCSCCQMD
jgi:hypothetical protein